MAQVAHLRPIVRAQAAARASRWAPYWQAIPSLLNSLVVALVGFALSGHVEQALKDRQATVSSVEAMNDLLTQIADEKDDQKRLGHVRRLSMYGVDAIGPLIILGLTPKLPVHYSAEGLNLIAIRHKTAVCDSLDSTVERGEQFVDAANQIEYLKQFSGKLHCPPQRRSWWKR